MAMPVPPKNPGMNWSWMSLPVIDGVVVGRVDRDAVSGVAVDVVVGDRQIVGIGVDRRDDRAVGAGEREVRDRDVVGVLQLEDV